MNNWEKLNKVYLLGVIDNVKSFVRENGKNWYSISIKVFHDLSDFSMGGTWFRVSSFEEELMLGRNQWILVDGRLSVVKSKSEEDGPNRYRTQIIASKIINVSSLVDKKIPTEDANQALESIRKRIEGGKEN